MSFSDYLENKVLDHVFGPTAYTAPSARYVSLHSADPGETGTSELAVANGYARQAIVYATNAASGSIANTSAPVFTNTGSAWSQATHFAVWDASSSGNCLGIGALTTPKTIGAGDTGTFAAGAMTITLG